MYPDHPASQDTEDGNGVLMCHLMGEHEHQLHELEGMTNDDIRELHAIEHGA